MAEDSQSLSLQAVESERVVKSVIYKYPVSSYPNGINLPPMSKIIHCESQDATVCVWALHHINAIADPFQEYPDVFIIDTGLDIDNNFLYRYIHLKTLHVGSFVWHVFAKKEVT